MTFNVRNICCIGAGYVGGPTMAVIADRCPHIQVNVVDLNKERIFNWNHSDLSKLPVYEPGLDEVIKRCRGRNLSFSMDVQKCISIADMIFISVNTPTKEKGIGAGQASDIKWVERSARQVASFSQGQTIVVEKSTLPVKTAETIKAILEASMDPNDLDSKSFFVLSNPEFLAEGTAINDLENPDRVLIGGEDKNAIDSLANIYLNWVSPSKILRTNLWSSELSKLTANAFLAQRISSINSISAVCEATGADVNEVALAIGMDKRIGPEFLKSGPGFGGSCFKKDILNLVYLCNYYGLEESANYWQNVVLLNEWQKKRISRLVVEKLFGTISGKRVTILGFAFKANTNDTRESPAIDICKDLLEEGGNLSIYDPRVSENQIEIDLGIKSSTTDKDYMEGSWTLYDSMEKSFKDSDAILIMTDWEEFRTIDWESVVKNMRAPSWLLDSRAVSDLASAKAAGLNIWRVGYGE